MAPTGRDRRQSNLPTHFTDPTPRSSLTTGRFQGQEGIDCFQLGRRHNTPTPRLEGGEEGVAPETEPQGSSVLTGARGTSFSVRPGRTPPPLPGPVARPSVELEEPSVRLAPVTPGKGAEV